MAAIRAALLALLLSGPAGAAPDCRADPGFGALDASHALTDLGPRGNRRGLDALRDLGVGTIIRYYDHIDETLACKTLVPEETEALLGAGFSLLAVFQSNGHDPLTFLTPGRGAADANRAIDLALMNGQPPGSAIYFGVDGVDEALKSANYEWKVSAGRAISEDRRKTLRKRMGRAAFSRHERFYDIYRTRFDEFFEGRPGRSAPEDMLPHVAAYFEEVRGAFHFLDHDERVRFRVGAYGSGLVCSYLLDRGLVDLCWLAQSTGWPGYEGFRESGRWSLRQEQVTTCSDWSWKSGGKVQFDFNRVGAADFGQWDRTVRYRFEAPRPTRREGMRCYAW